MLDNGYIIEQTLGAVRISLFRFRHNKCLTRSAKNKIFCNSTVKVESFFRGDIFKLSTILAVFPGYMLWTFCFSCIYSFICLFIVIYLFFSFSWLGARKLRNKTRFACSLNWVHATKISEAGMDHVWKTILGYFFRIFDNTHLCFLGVRHKLKKAVKE